MRSARATIGQVVRAVGRREVEAGTACAPSARAPSSARPGCAACRRRSARRARRPPARRARRARASSSVCAKSRAVTSTSWPAARSRCTSGRKTTGWAGAERSIQILIGARPPGALPSVGRARARSRPAARGPCARRRARSRAARCARPGPRRRRSAGARCPRRPTESRPRRSSAGVRAAPAVLRGSGSLGRGALGGSLLARTQLHAAAAGK